MIVSADFSLCAARAPPRRSAFEYVARDFVELHATPILRARAVFTHGFCGLRAPIATGHHRFVLRITSAIFYERHGDAAAAASWRQCLG